MIKLLPVLQDYCTVQLWRKVGGVNWHPHTIIWEVYGNTLVDRKDFHRFYRFLWLKSWNPSIKSYYAYRHDRDVNDKRIVVSLAREVLGLQIISSDQADHINHDTLDNRHENLRVVNYSQSLYNRVSYGQLRFQRIQRHHNGYRARIYLPSGKEVCFIKMVKDVEAALMYNEAAKVVYGEYAYLNTIPEDEMPTEERLEWLRKMVIEKLKMEGILCQN